MTDYDALKDAFEMAEVLHDLDDRLLEVKTVNADDNKLVSVFFIFNEDLELTKVYTE